MDEYEAMMRTFEITPMPENFKSAQGKRVQPNGCTHVALRAVRGSFVQIHLAVTMPVKSLLVLEERPAFSHRYPVDSTTILRAALDSPALPGALHLIDWVEDDDGVRKGDVVLESGSMELRPYQTSQLTALLPVPSDTAPGEYTGKIRFYAHSMLYDERLAREITFSVRVEAVTLPARGEGTFYLNLWQHIFNIARKCEVKAYTPAHLAALRPYAKALGELGNKVITVLLSDIPWNGQGCYKDAAHPADLYEYSYVRIRRHADGTFAYDFSFAQAYIDLMKEYGATDVMLTGLYGIWTDEKEGFVKIVEDWADPIRVSYLDEATGAIRFMRTRAEIEDYFRAIYRWIQERGMQDSCFLMGDEVDLGWVSDGWTATLETLHRLMPAVRMCWDNKPASIMSDTYKDERIDIYTPQIDSYAAADDELRARVRSRVRPGGKCLWSVCCAPPVMNSFLYTDLCEVRLHGLITERLKLDGFIRWNFTVWPDQPRDSLISNGWPAGDTCFVYPGRGGQCLKSLRYLALRRGIEDFELAQMVKRCVPDAETVLERALHCVLREYDMTKWDFEDYFGREKYMSLCAQDYEAARGILIDALLGQKEEA